MTSSSHWHPEQARFAVLEALATEGLLSGSALAHLKWKQQSDKEILKDVAANLKRLKGKNPKAKTASSMLKEKITKLQQRFGLAEKNGTGSFQEYVEGLLRDASDVDAKMERSRALALYAAVPDERQLLAAFLLLFSLSDAPRSRREAEEALRNYDALLQKVDCQRLQKLLRETSSFVASSYGRNQTPGMVAAAKKCEDAKGFLRKYLTRTHVSQSGQHASYGAGSVIATADSARGGDSDPMSLLRVGVVARCFPTDSLETVRQKAEVCNDVLLDELRKQCEASPGLAYSLLGMFHFELAASALKREDDDAARSQLLDGVKKFLETTVDPAPPLGGTASAAEKLLEKGFELGLVPLLRDCKTKEKELRKRLAGFLEQNDKRAFEKDIVDLLRRNPYFNARIRRSVGESFLNVEGAAAFQKPNRESYEAFLWRFFKERVTRAPPTSASLSPTPSIPSPLSPSPSSPMSLPPSPSTPLSLPPSPSTPRPRSPLPGPISPHIRTSLAENVYALLPFLLPLVLHSGRALDVSDALDQMVLFIFENVQQLTSLNLPLLFSSGKVFFKALTDEETEEIRRLAENREEQWHLLNCLCRPFQCKVKLAGWSLAKTSLAFFVLWACWLQLHPVSYLQTVDFAFDLALGVRPVLAATSAVAHGAGSALKRAAELVQGDRKKRRVDAPLVPPAGSVAEGDRKRGAEEAGGRNKRQRLGEAEGVEAAREPQAAIAEKKEGSTPVHHVARAANSIFEGIRGFGASLWRRSAVR
jgi:hypothetical protein